MNWKRLLENNSLQKKKVSFREVEKVLEKAYKCLKAANLLLEAGVEESVFKETYEKSTEKINIKFSKLKSRFLKIT